MGARPTRMEERPATQSQSIAKRIFASQGIKNWGRRVVYVLLPLTVAFAGFAAPVLGVKAYKYVMQTGHFYVKDVLVDGNAKLSFEDIRSLAGLQPNTHLLATNLEDIEQSLESHDWVDTARVERELPNRLIIRIQEHRPVAYLALGELWLVNRSGKPFSRVEGDADLDLPILTGLSRQRLTNEATREDSYARIRGAVSIARLYQKMGLTNRWPIGEIHIDAADHYSLVLSKDGTHIELGSAPFEQKLYKLEWVLENLRTRQQIAEYVLLDLSRDGRDDGRVIVKADIAPTTTDKAQESLRFAIPPNDEGDSDGLSTKPKSGRQQLKGDRKNRKQNLPRRSRPQSASRGRGA